MTECFAKILSVGGKTNSLGRSAEVIEIVLKDQSRLEELYACTRDNDAWVRMRAIDAIEKIGRQKHDWLLPYIDRFQSELTSSTQPSILWHLAQMYSQIRLTPKQKINAISWLKKLLSTSEIDWIVAVNAMKTVVQFAKDGSITTSEAATLIDIQKNHKSKSVIRIADKLGAELLNELRA